jgi:pSer/pThr/pTyr-binding forkhead associated (FHA) protein
MAAKSFQLVVRSGPTPGKVYPVMKNEIVIGRDPNADILINDAEVSRHHASIKLVTEGYIIEDLGSTNGTVINGQRLTGPHILLNGEIINLGEHISLVWQPQPIMDPDATVAMARMGFDQNNNLPPVQTPRKTAVPIPQPPIAQNRLPEAGDEISGRKKLPNWAIIAIIAVVAVACICVISLWVVDANNMWCSFFSFLPGCPTP